MKQQLANLEKLVARHDSLAAEINSLSALRDRLTAERDKLVRQARVDDNESVTLAGALLTKLEMIPHRTAAIEAAQLALEEPMRAAERELREAYKLALEDRQAKGMAFLVTTVKPIIGAKWSANAETGNKDGAALLARQMWPATRFGEELAPFSFYFEPDSTHPPGSVLADGPDPEVHFARQWIDHCKAFLALAD